MGCAQPVAFHPSALLTQEQSPFIFILSMFPPLHITNSSLFPTPLTQFLHITTPLSHQYFAASIKDIYILIIALAPGITSKEIKPQTYFTYCCSLLAKVCRKLHWKFCLIPNPAAFFMDTAAKASSAWPAPGSTRHMPGKMASNCSRESPGWIFDTG